MANLSGLGAFASGLSRGLNSGARLGLIARQVQQQDKQNQAYSKIADLIDQYSSTQPAAGPGLAPQSAPNADVRVGAAPAAVAPGATPIAPQAGLQQVAFKPSAGSGPAAEDLQVTAPLTAIPQSAPPTQANPDAGLHSVAGAAAPAQAPKNATPSQKVGFGLYRNPNLLGNPQFLNQAAKIFIDAGMPQGFKWLEQGYKAQKENGIEAVKYLLGGNPDAALRAFNLSGTKATSIDPAANNGWKVTYADGRQETYSRPQLIQKLRLTLDPKDFFATLGAEQKNQISALKTASDISKNTAQTNLANAKTNQIKTGGGSAKAIQTMNAKVKMLVSAGVNPNTAKKIAAGMNTLTQKDVVTLASNLVKATQLSDNPLTLPQALSRIYAIFPDVPRAGGVPSAPGTKPASQPAATPQKITLPNGKPLSSLWMGQ